MAPVDDSGQVADGELTRNTPAELEGFNNALDKLTRADDEAVKRLQRYFSSDTELFTGRYFELFAGRGAPNEFTPNDIMAVTTLSIRLTSRYPWQVELLNNPKSETENLLNQLPTDTDLWDAPKDLLGPNGPMQELWQLLRTIKGIDAVIATKLMAAKRPRLVPIVDSVVGETLPTGRSHWEAFYLALRDDERRARIEKLREATGQLTVSGYPIELSLLRTIDVAVWMSEQ